MLPHNLLHLTKPPKDLFRLFIVLFFCTLLISCIGYVYNHYKDVEPIRIGVIHSLTGTMAVSERPLVVAVQLAVQEINARGGVLGRPLQIVLADGQSEPKVFAEQAKELITRENVSVLFGCWTSKSRNAVKEVVEKYRHLLFYPVQYEGLEQSENIIYTGSVPNQQIIPGTRWALENLGKHVFLIGSDSFFSRSANLIIVDLIRASGGQVLGERYLPLDSSNVDTLVEELMRLKPDVIINTIKGDSILSFYRALQASVLKDTAVLSFSISEAEIASHPELAKGNHYATWSYFQSLDNPRNKEFIQNYQKIANKLLQADVHNVLDKQPLPVTSDPVEAAYFSVYLWAQAANEVDSFKPGHVNPAVLRQSFHAPSSIVSIDKATRHTWKMFRIGKIQPDGQFKELQNSQYSLRPEPYPGYRSKAEWKNMLQPLIQDTP